MRNVPVDLTEEILLSHLKPLMGQLLITHYLCNKPKTRNFAFLTFLNLHDGERFLYRYGQNAGSIETNESQALSGLKIMDNFVHFSPSSRQRNGKLPEFALRALQHATQEKQSPKSVKESQAQEVTLPLQSWSCGYLEFVDGRLGFSPEIRLNTISQATIKFTKRNAIVKQNGILARVPTNTIIELIWSEDGSLTLSLSTVPFFFSSENEIVAEATAADASLPLDRFRLSPSGFDRPKPYARTCELTEDHAVLVGFCLVYQFKVTSAELSGEIEKLKKFGITITSYDLSIPESLLYQSEDFLTQLDICKAELAKINNERSLDFGHLFQLQALFQNGHLTPSTVTNLARALKHEAIRRKKSGEFPLSAEAIRGLILSIDWPLPFGDAEEFGIEHIFEEIQKNDERLKQGLCGSKISGTTAEYSLNIFRATVTPSRITLHGPEMEPANRVLRKFATYHEFFLRVQFCDENGQNISFSPNVDSRKVLNRFKDVLSNGIQIAGREYGFLGFSHSSIRAHSVWVSTWVAIFT